MNVPEVPQKAKDYFWVLAVFVGFGLVQAFSNKFVGGSSNVPAPPTIMVQPVVVGTGNDGTMRVLSIESPVKK